MHHPYNLSCLKKKSPLPESKSFTQRTVNIKIEVPERAASLMISKKPRVMGADHASERKGDLRLEETGADPPGPWRRWK